MIFDGHGDIWTDVTNKRIKNKERDIFRKYHLEKFQKGGVNGGIFVIWLDPPYDADPVKRSKEIVESIQCELQDASDILNPVKKFFRPCSRNSSRKNQCSDRNGRAKSDRRRYRPDQLLL